MKTLCWISVSWLTLVVFCLSAEDSVGVGEGPLGLAHIMQWQQGIVSENKFSDIKSNSSCIISIKFADRASLISATALSLIVSEDGSRSLADILVCLSLEGMGESASVVVSGRKEIILDYANILRQIQTKGGIIDFGITPLSLRVGSD